MHALFKVKNNMQSNIVQNYVSLEKVHLTENIWPRIWTQHVMSEFFCTAHIQSLSSK